MAPLRRPSYVMSSMSWTMLAITFMTYWLVIVHQGYQSALMIYKKMSKAHYKSASNTGTLEPCGEISRPSWRNMFQLDQLETSEKDLSGCCVCHSFPFPVWSLRRAFPLPLPPSHRMWGWERQRKIPLHALVSDLNHEFSRIPAALPLCLSRLSSLTGRHHLSPQAPDLCHICATFYFLFVFFLEHLTCLSPAGLLICI